MASGNSEGDFAALVLIFQPLKSLYFGFIWILIIWKGISEHSFPFISYAVQTDSCLNPSSTSAFVITNFVTPLIMQAKRRATRSIQPQRLGLPVVAPNSLPVCLNCSLVSSFSSVGKGP